MQHSASITHHPIDLIEHGRRPGGQALFRIVWADSRIDKVKSEGQIHELPRYEAAEGKWILEKWLSAYELTHMTPAQYAELLASQMFGSAEMPYPTDGDYELSYVFEGSVDPGKAHKIAAMVQFGKVNLTDAERAQGVKDAAEKKAFDLDAVKTEIIKTALTRGNTLAP
jgi:hypothetical protein